MASPISPTFRRRSTDPVMPPVMVRLDRKHVPDAAWLGWLTSGGYRPNLLIECSEAGLEATLRQVMAWSSPPLCYCGLPGPLQLPQPGAGTLVLHDVAELSTPQQIAVYDWLSADAGGIQVLSLTSASLAARVADGRFLESLYYRLNVIRL